MIIFDEGMSKKHKILCFLSLIGDTKDAKRVELLQKAGFLVSIVAYERDNYVSRMPECEIALIGKIKTGNYLSRIGLMLRSIKKLRKIIKKHDLIYALSPDLAFIAFLASFGLNKPLVMEVADIREIEVSKSIAGFLVRLLVKFIVKNCDLIVVTSEAFISEYYIKKIKIKVKDFYLLENKVDYKIPIFTESRRNQELNFQKIRIGYFGLLRDNWTVKVLLNILDRYPDNFEVFLAGVNMLNKFNLEEISKKQKGFTYFGPYHSPSDLPEIYQKVDVIVLFYPEHNAPKEWFDVKKICRSNRFYEACYFKKPLIAFSYTEDGRNIQNLGIGLVLENDTINQVVEKVFKVVTHDQISQWVQNIMKLPREVYEMKNEPLELKARIDSIMSKYNI